ncbi:hypothetical protein F5146DRAFT_1130949 [Armillaria mellea]|nr:hypothetical protein F5146DRAFT_1130949 [Armillaria mellea]
MTISHYSMTPISSSWNQIRAYGIPLVSFPMTTYKNIWQTVSTSPRPDSPHVYDFFPANEAMMSVCVMIFIAVVAERGLNKFREAFLPIEADEEGRKTDANRKGKQKQRPPKHQGRSAST